MNEHQEMCHTLNVLQYRLNDLQKNLALNTFVWLTSNTLRDSQSGRENGS